MILKKGYRIYSGAADENIILTKRCLRNVNAFIGKEV